MKKKTPDRRKRTDIEEVTQEEAAELRANFERALSQIVTQPQEKPKKKARPRKS